MSLTPKNWKEFQHYSDRKPAWIKLHKGLLDDFAFARLPLASRALAPLLWLLASEYQDGTITASNAEIAFRLHTTEQEVEEAIKPLIDAGFFIASEPLAERKQGASLEKEKQEEKQEETEGGASAPEPARKKREKKYATSLSEGFEPNFEAATRVGLSKREAEREFQKFKNHAAMGDRKCVNWQAAWSNWCINAATYLKKPPPGVGPASALTITPESRSWNAWKAHFRDGDQNMRASLMDKCADEGRPFTVSSEWPPGHEMNNAA